MKPSNVLVTEVDGNPVLKVIDFGVARATDRLSVGLEAFTMDGQIIGTPAYMSPEQANLDSSDIDTGTDVYSLGVVLYELLVGALPLDIQSMRKIALFEVLRAIRETPVPTPAARITQMGAAAEALALQRSTNPSQLKRDLTGDLDSIVMKAIDKDRHCRYASASEFAADIERYLKSEPVLAGPPGAAYRLRKFAVRNKLPVAAAAAVALALIAGIIMTMWEARVAEHERAIAISEKAKAERQSSRADAQAAQAGIERSRAEEKAREADELREKADQQRREAEELFGGVRDLANSMLFDVAEQLSEMPGATAARETLVRKGVEYLNRLSKSPRATPELRRELGGAYLKIGELQGRTIHPSLGDPRAAFENAERSVLLLEPLAKSSPHNPKVIHLMIRAYLLRGRMQEKQIGADADYARAIALAEARVATDPKNQEARHDLASSLAQLMTRSSSPMISLPELAEKTIMRARALFEELLNEGSKDPDIRRELAWQIRNLGYLEWGRNPQRSLELFKTSLDQFASLAREFPSNVVYSSEVASALDALTGILPRLGRTKEAVENARQSVTIRQQVVAGATRNVTFWSKLFYSQFGLASLLSDTGSRQQAIEVFKQASAEGDRVVAEQPDNPEFRFKKVELNERIGAETGSVDLKTALDRWGRAAAELEEPVRKYPDRYSYGTLLARLQLDLGRSGGSDGAAGWYRTDAKRQEYDVSVDPATPYDGKPSRCIKSKQGVKTTSTGGLGMEFNPSLYIGKRVRLSANLKSAGVNRWGGLYMGVYNAANDRLASDNMFNRSIKGTTEWQTYSVVLDVPDRATSITIGLQL